ncbi:glycoprotein xg [Limosa lapponica baueri]|uniref:Glycoprotein xg n=1 Tax=Limosa lapponica baueri TaxID=1758121 RepID=A0A2I0T6P3_LIMLA|nr:glycoprotein xg [Limosa lapponica baueri]
MTSLDLLVMLFLMDPRMLLAFLATMAHFWLTGILLSTRTPRSFPHSCSPAGQPQCVLVQGAIPPQVQHPTLAFVEFHQVPLCPALQPVQVSLYGGTAFWRVSHPSQFCIISKRAEDTFHPFIEVIDENIEEDWTQY